MADEMSTITGSSEFTFVKYPCRCTQELVNSQAPFVLPAVWSGSVCFSPEEREECAPSTAAARAPGLL